MGRAVAGVEGADLGAGLHEARVVGRDGEVADDVEHVPAPDGPAGDGGDDGLGARPDLALEVEHVEALHPGRRAARIRALHLAVAVLAADALVAAGAEGVVAHAAQDDHADRASSRAALRASCISRTVSGRKALRTSGRLMVMRAIPAVSVPGVPVS